MTEKSGSIPASSEKFYILESVQAGCVFTQPPIQWILGALFLEIEGTSSEVDYTPIPAAEIKGVRSCTSTFSP
jgi:hypothetical protein